MIKAYFADKDVGSVAALPGKLNGIPVWIHCMKEPDYITMMMSNYGTLERTGDTWSRSWIIGLNSHHVTFKYPELVCCHYKNRHHVDDHNKRRPQPISLEETWATKFGHIVSSHSYWQWWKVMHNYSTNTIEMMQRTVCLRSGGHWLQS